MEYDLAETDFLVKRMLSMLAWPCLTRGCKKLCTVEPQNADSLK